MSLWKTMSWVFPFLNFYFIFLRLPYSFEIMIPPYSCCGFKSVIESHFFYVSTSWYVVQIWNYILFSRMYHKHSTSSSLPAPLFDCIFFFDSILFGSIHHYKFSSSWMFKCLLLFGFIMGLNVYHRLFIIVWLTEKKNLYHKKLCKNLRKVIKRTSSYSRSWKSINRKQWTRTFCTLLVCFTSTVFWS